MKAGCHGIALRLWAPGDEATLVRLANNRNVWRNLTNRFPHPYTHDDAVAWIRRANAIPEDSRHWAVVRDGNIVGAVGFDRLDDLRRRTAEIGYWVGEPFWGQGIATRALTLATEFAFRDYDFLRLQAGVLAWNPASCRVLEKAGYRLEVQLRQQAFKDSEVCDIRMYALLREDYPRGLTDRALSCGQQRLPGRSSTAVDARRLPNLHCNAPLGVRCRALLDGELR